MPPISSYLYIITTQPDRVFHIDGQLGMLNFVSVSTTWPQLNQFRPGMERISRHAKSLIELLNLLLAGDLVSQAQKLSTAPLDQHAKE